MNLQEHQIAIHKIANEVNQLKLDTTAKTIFIEHIDRFCKMVEHYGQALQPYIEKLIKAEKQLLKNKPKPGQSIGLVDLCPPPKGWVAIDSRCHCFKYFNFPFSVFGLPYKPRKAVNPLLWMSFTANSSIQRKLSENEKLMCDYVLLSVIHDGELQTPTDRSIFPADYKGRWFKLNEFIEDCWYHYHYHNFGSNQSPTANEKLTQLQRALGRIKTDLASKQKTDKSIDDNWHNKDFTEVLWDGQKYKFNKTQALAIQYLWANKRASEKGIGEHIESQNEHYRLRHTFRQKKGEESTMHSAWGTMIVKDGRGIYALNEKNQESPEK